MEKFRKVNGNYKPRRIPPIEKGGSIISTPNEMGNIYRLSEVNASYREQQEITQY